MLVFNLLKGLLIFNAFDETRYYIGLIKRVLQDIGYFFILFLYSILAFGLLLLISREESFNFYNLWGSLFEMNFKQVSYLAFNETVSLEYFFYFIASVINTILMLSLLISFLEDSYDHFQLEIAVINLREKAILGLGIQRIMFWNRNKIDESYIHSFTDASIDENKIDVNGEWKGKLNYIQMKINKNLQEKDEKDERRFKYIEDKIE